MSGETRSLDEEPRSEGSASGPVAAAGNGPSEVHPGDCLGRYTVRFRIGGGGMGEVFAAHDPQLDRVVALKMLKPGIGGGSPEARARFQREAQAMARLNHPNVVSVFDVGTVGDRVFVAMELVDGPTLAVWLARGPHGWRELVDVFLQAARGLAAAHRAGIVHRDFKPSNVILGDRVRVADFGLARTAREPDDVSGSANITLDATVTQAGQQPGTPAYMAPEQRAGLPATAASDQYAFAVALHEALYGVRPDESATPPRADAPSWLRAVVERALAARPEDRYPSMGQVVAELARDRGRARRRWLVAGLVVVVAAGGYVVQRRSQASPCGVDAALIAPLWDDAARAQVEAAFRQTGRPYAEATWTRVDASLRGRLDTWARGHREACEATHVRHEQSDAMLDLRMRCLGRAKVEIAALVALLGKADAGALDRAAQAAAQAGDVEACADLAALSAATPPPRNPAVARQVEELGQVHARLIALNELGKWKEGVVAGRELVARARIVDYPPVLARALYTTGSLELSLEETEVARETLFQAVRAASEAKDDELVTSALSKLVRGVRFEAADAVYSMAQAAAARAGNPPKLLSRLYDARAWALQLRGDFQGVLPLRFLVLALDEKLYGPESYAVARALAGLGATLDYLGRATEVGPYLERAISISERAIGPEHPNTVTMIHNYGVTRIDAKEPDAAVPILERALVLREKIFGTHHPWVAQTLGSLGHARLEQRRFTEARALLERALQIYREKGGRDPIRAGVTIEMLARVALGEGELAEAHARFQEALAFARERYGDENIRLVQIARGDAEVLLLMGRVADARATIDRALVIEVKVLGEDHVDRAETLRVFAAVLHAERRFPDAIVQYRRSLSMWEKQYGPDSPALVATLFGLSEALVDSGDARGGRAAAERAVAVARTTSADTQAYAQFILAEARWAAGERTEAMTLARDARAKLAAMPSSSTEIIQIDRWLASHKR